MGSHFIQSIEVWVLVSVINNCVTSLGNDLPWTDEGLRVGIIFGIRNQLNCIHKNESKRDVQLHAMVKETQTRVSLVLPISSRQLLHETLKTTTATTVQLD